MEHNKFDVENIKITRSPLKFQNGILINKLIGMKTISCYYKYINSRHIYPVSSTNQEWVV